MRKVIVGVGLLALAWPTASQAAGTSYYAGSMDGLPGSSITFKVAEGSSTPLRIEAKSRALCSAGKNGNGGPAPNTQLLNSFGRVVAEVRGYFVLNERLPNGGRRMVKGKPAGGSHRSARTAHNTQPALSGFNGSYSSTVVAARPEGDKLCRTGLLQWNAISVAQNRWQKLRF